MSIFPKRTRRGTTVTIHWNFNTTGLTQAHIYPYARIGVRAPDGQLTMLHDGHLLRLPDLSTEPMPAAEAAGHYLPKNVPLLVLASYLSGRHSQATLVDMLRGMHTGRHYYFSYQVAADAPLGRYTLLSELYTDGQVRHSGTAADDFFLVEQLELEPERSPAEGGCRALITNPGPEPVPVRVVEYWPGKQPATANYVREVPALGTLRVESDAAQCFVLYNEERETLPVHRPAEPGFLRNQQLLSLDKVVGDQPTTYVLTGTDDEAYELTGPSREVWRRADGLTGRHQLNGPDQQAAYDEMLAAGLIIALPR